MRTSPTPTTPNREPSGIQKATNTINRLSRGIVNTPVVGWAPKAVDYMAGTFKDAFQNPQEAPRIFKESYVDPPVKFAQTLGKAAATIPTQKTFQQTQNQLNQQADLYLDKAIKASQAGDTETANRYFQATRETRNQARGQADERIGEMGRLGAYEDTGKPVADVGRFLSETELGRSGVGTINTAAALYNPTASLKTMGASGVLNSLLEGPDRQEGSFWRGVDRSSKWAGLVNVTNPVIRGLTGKYLSGLDPRKRELFTRGANALFNILEDRGIDYVYGRERKLADDLLSGLTGFALGGAGTKEDWENLKKEMTTAGLSETDARAIREAFTAGTGEKWRLQFTDETGVDRTIIVDKATYPGWTRYLESKGIEYESNYLGRSAGGGVIGGQPPDVKDLEAKAEAEGEVRPGESEEALGPKLEPGESFEEPGEGLRQRGVLRTTQESEQFSKEVKEEIAELPQYYRQISNPESIARADDVIKNNGVDAARQKFFDRDFKDFTTESAVGMRLFEKYESQGDYDIAREIDNQLAIRATDAGRGTQMFAKWANDSPSYTVKKAEKIFKDANERLTILDKLFPGSYRIELDDEMKKIISDRKMEINRMPEGDAKIEAEKELMEAIYAQVPPSATEWIDAYRYSNLLSGWANLRNFQANAFSTGVVRPFEMVFEAPIDFVRATLTGTERQHYLTEVPEYYKALWNNIPEGYLAAGEVMKGETGIRGPDISAEGVTDIEQRALQQRTPASLTFFTRLMEAGDKFYRPVLSGGDYAARVSAGEPEDAAKEAAIGTYKSLLLRPGSEKETRALLKQIDNLQDIVLKTRNSNIFTKTVLPFVNVAFRNMKQNLMRTPVTGPVTTIGAKDQTEAWAKVIAGTVPFVISAYKASQGDTAWLPPKDEEGKNAWYASGKKRGSMKFELPEGLQQKFNKEALWVPFFMLGPYGLSAALPAAWHHYNKDHPDADVNKWYEKLGQTTTGALRYSTGELPVRSMLDYLNLLMGDPEYDFLENLAFTVEQYTPVSSLQRDLAKVFDPIYRQTDGMMDRWKRDLPWLVSMLEGEVPSVEPRRELQPYLTPEGRESKRTLLDYLPYSVGLQEPGTEEPLQRLRQEKQIQAPDRWLRREQRKINDTIENIMQNKDLTKVERQRQLQEQQEKLTRLQEEYLQLQSQTNIRPPGPTIQPRTTGGSSVRLQPSGERTDIGAL